MRTSRAMLSDVEPSAACAPAPLQGKGSFPQFRVVALAECGTHALATSGDKESDAGAGLTDVLTS